MTLPETERIKPSRPDDDVEWEYEYDEDETEDFYFTLDLTTHVPDAVKRVKTGVSSAATPKATANAASNEALSLEKSPGQRPQDDQLSARGVQVIDLRTPNPLVKFEGRIYSCYWSTDLGTQFHVAKTGKVDRPCRVGNLLDVIGLSQARLLGRPVTLQLREMSKGRRNEHEMSDVSNDSDESSSSNSETDETTERAEVPLANILPAPGEPLVIPRDLCKDAEAEEEAAFLEGLSAVKVKKGEYDPISVYSVKHYSGPSKAEQEEIRKQALKADIDRATRARLNSKLPTAQPQRKKHKRSTVTHDEAAEAAKRARGVKPGRRRNEDLRIGLAYQTEDGLPPNVHSPPLSNGG